jgi:hypothetical protein
VDSGDGNGDAVPVGTEAVLESPIGGRLRLERGRPGAADAEGAAAAAAARGVFVVLEARAQRGPALDSVVSWTTFTQSLRLVPVRA